MASRVFIKVLPSPVMCSGNPTFWESFEVNAADRVTVYPPFASGGPGRPQHPSVNVREALTRIPGSGGNLKALPPQRSIPYLSVEPTNENRLVLIGVDAKHDGDFDIFPADTISHEIFEKMDARIYLDEALRNLRRFTRQVWIGRAATYTDCTTSCAFELTDERRGHGAVFVFEPVHYLFRSIRLCTEEIWREAWRLALSPSIELGVDIVHGTHHALLTDREQQFYLQAGITIERLKYLLWDYLKASNACTTAQYRAALNDTSKPHRYFSECLEEILDRSLLREFPSAHASVKRLWIARGLIAHGKAVSENLLVQDPVADIECLYDLARFVDSIRGLNSSILIL